MDRGSLLDNRVLAEARISSHANASTDAREACTNVEVAEIQKRLGERQLEVQHIQQLIENTHAEQDAAHRACAAGIVSAKTQMDRLKGEIAAARQAQVDCENNVVSRDTDDNVMGAAAVSPMAEAHAVAEGDFERESFQALRMEARKLRHDLSKWKHQAEVLEAERPKQNDELARLKVELTHILEVLESTRHAVKHQEVDQTLQHVDSPSKSMVGSVKLLSGGHSRVEALAEKSIRQRTERRNEDLFAKAKQLTNIVAAQQLLIHRLEKQLIFEEGVLERKNAKLADESTRQKGLKTVMRKCSDEAVFMALRGPVMVPARKKRPMTKRAPGNDLLDGQQATGETSPSVSRSESVPLLPRI